MKLTVFSNSKGHKEEIGTVIALFQNGLGTFHLRKPRFSRKEMEEYIKEIPPSLRKHIILHSHHKLALKYGMKGIHLTRNHRKRKWKTRLKIFWYKTKRPNILISRTCHQLSDLLSKNHKYYDLVFLSPVFEGISSNNHSRGFSVRSVVSVLKKTHHKVYALGGVKQKNLKEVHEMGFDGAAFVGVIWKREGEKGQVIREGLRICHELTSGMTKEKQVPNDNGELTSKAVSPSTTAIP